MKTITAAFFILILFLAVSAQLKMTDREFDGFKGNVKTVSIEIMPISGLGVSKKNKREIWEKWSYDKDGRKTEEYNVQGKSKLIFRNVNGVKTSKMIEIEGGSTETFNYRYVYEYDSQGRVKTERESLNDSNVVNVKTFKYDDKGRIIEKIDNSPTSILKAVYKYDDKGNLIEELQEQKPKGEFGSSSKSRTVYSNYKVDAQGNWTERKSIAYYEGETSEEGDEPYVSMNYQVITYYP